MLLTCKMQKNWKLKIVLSIENIFHLIFHLCLKERVREYLESEYRFGSTALLNRRKKAERRRVNLSRVCFAASTCMRMEKHDGKSVKGCGSWNVHADPFIWMKRFVIGAITVVKQVRWPLPTLPHLVHPCHHLYLARLTVPCILD